MRGKFWVCAVVLLLSVPAFAVTTKSLSDGLTAQDVASALTGKGAVISNVKITGATSAIGSFTDGGALGIVDGVVLSTGNVSDVTGPNDVSDKSGSLNAAGHPALDAVVAPFKTFDAAVLEFDVITESPTFTIRYVFASEEYREWVGSEFNDVFGFFVGGTNIALTPGTSEPVTVNTINHQQNSSLYRDNESGSGTQFDGLTVPLTAVAIVEPGVLTHIRIAIADTSDDVFDSAVMIAQGGISGSQIAPIPVPPVSTIAMESGSEGVEIAIPLYYAFMSSPPTLSAYGVPGATVTFSPLYVGEDGRHYVNMKIVLGPDTPTGDHSLTIRSAVGEAEAFATIRILTDCKPPYLFGTGQPQTRFVDRGTKGTFTITAQGSGPFTYQWYRGYPGMVHTPVVGAVGPTLEIEHVNEMAPYWVRITNPCGSYNSLSAFMIPR